MFLGHSKYQYCLDRHDNRDGSFQRQRNIQANVNRRHNAGSGRASASAVFHENYKVRQILYYLKFLYHRCPIIASFEVFYSQTHLQDHSSKLSHSLSHFFSHQITSFQLSDFPKPFNPKSHSFPRHLSSNFPVPKFPNFSQFLQSSKLPTALPPRFSTLRTSTLGSIAQCSTCNYYRFVEPFAQKVDYWERALSTVGEVLEMTLLIQRGYMYMDNIFTTGDIRKQLPKETDQYDNLTKEWKKITSRMAAHALALPATHDPRTYLEKIGLKI